LCFDCSQKEHQYDYTRALWPYEGAIKEAIHHYKYQDMKHYSGSFAHEMALFFRQHLNWNIDLIISVPLHPIKEKARGYNQAHLIGKALSRKLHIPYANHIIYRKKNTLPQKTLSDKERTKNIKNAFSTRENILKCDIMNKHIMIVDDIYTTGSTIDSIAEILKAHGASEVYGLCIAIGRGFS